MNDKTGTDAQPVLNIYQRLNEAKKKIAYIRKDKKVESYMAVTHDAVTAATRQVLVDCGIAVIPSEICNVVVNTGATSSKGTPLIRYEATFVVRFVNIDLPEDFIAMTVTAHANDYGDKAPGKCLSYAVKSALLKALSLETGEDDEGRVQQHEGLGTDFLSESKIAIDAAANPFDLKQVWAGIVTHCKAAKDMETYNHLKAAVTARGAALNQLEASERGGKGND